MTIRHLPFFRLVLLTPLALAACTAANLQRGVYEETSRAICRDRDDAQTCEANRPGYPAYEKARARLEAAGAGSGRQAHSGR